MKFNKLKTCLMIVLLALTSIFMSCEHNSKPSGNVMLSVSGRVMNILAARAGEELSDLTLNIALYDSNDKELETKSEANWDKEEKRSITFKPVEIGTVVYAKATLYAGEEKLYEGTTESKSIEAGGIILNLVLKAVESAQNESKEEPTPEPIPEPTPETEDDTFTVQLNYLFEDDLGTRKTELTLIETKEFDLETTEDDIFALINSLTTITDGVDYADYNLKMLRVIYFSGDANWLTLEENEKTTLVSSVLANGKVNKTDFSIDVYLCDKTLSVGGSISIEPSLYSLTITYDPVNAITYRNYINIQFSVTPPRAQV